MRWDELRIEIKMDMDMDMEMKMELSLRSRANLLRTKYTVQSHRSLCIIQQAERSYFYPKEAQVAQSGIPKRPLEGPMAL